MIFSQKLKTLNHVNKMFNKRLINNIIEMKSQFVQTKEIVFLGFRLISLKQ